MRKWREHVYLVAFLHLCKDGVSSEQLNLAASFPGSWYYAGVMRVLSGCSLYGSAI